MMKAQTALYSFVQALGEFGLPLPLETSDDIVLQLPDITLNELDQRFSFRKREKPVHTRSVLGAERVHEKLTVSDKVYMIELPRLESPAPHVSKDGKAVEGFAQT